MKIEKVYQLGDIKIWAEDMVFQSGVPGIRVNYISGVLPPSDLPSEYLDGKIYIYQSDNGIHIICADGKILHSEMSIPKTVFDERLLYIKKACEILHDIKSKPKAQKIYISNAFASSFLTEDALAVIRHICLDEAKEFASSASACSIVGHESTAQIYSQVLDVSIPQKRETITAKIGDQFLVGVFRGQRPAEGQILTEQELTNMELEWQLITIVDIHDLATCQIC